MTTPGGPIYAGYRYPSEIFCTAAWLYYRFPLSLRMVEELLAARSIEVSYETVRQWGLKPLRAPFGSERRSAVTNGISTKLSSPSPGANSVSDVPGPFRP